MRVEDVTREEELARELEEQKQRSERRLELALGWLSATARRWLLRAMGRFILSADT